VASAVRIFPSSSARKSVTSCEWSELASRRTVISATVADREIHLERVPDWKSENQLPEAASDCSSSSSSWRSFRRSCTSLRVLMDHVEAEERRDPMSPDESVDSPLGA
jgi:hypothetical protein